MEISKIERENESHVVAVSDDPHMRMIEMAVTQGADIEKLTQLMDLQDRYDKKNAIKAFNKAMSTFQSMVPAIEKMGVVDFTSDKGRTYYTYAKLEDIGVAIKPALKETGLSYRFKQSQDISLIEVTCVITHEMGHFEEFSISSGKDKSGGKDELKSIASTLSYLRRYTLTGAFGLTVGGEDGAIENAQDNGESQTPNSECYPDVEFNKNFPAWAKKMKSQGITAESMLTKLQKKGLQISADQYEKIKLVHSQNEEG